MHASDLIASEIVPLMLGDDAARALDLMEDLRVAQLPVVSRARLLGVVDAGQLEEQGGTGSVEDLMERVEVPFVHDAQHVFDVVRLMLERRLTVLPVVDHMGRYLGSVSMASALQGLAQVANVLEPGSVVTLEMNVADYSLNQLSRIVEGNDGRLLSAFARTLPGTTRVEVVLKINREDISGILQAFDRYDLLVKRTYQGSRFQEDLRERFEGLMRYLDT
jgi:Mg/Co/Ni transporter MgtE